jgi:hypothetical protein
MILETRAADGVIPSRADDEGPHSWNFEHTNHGRPEMTAMASQYAVAVERSRDPSARYASLGMTTL